MNKFIFLIFIAIVFTLLFLNRANIEQLFRFAQSERDVQKIFSDIPFEDQEKLETFFKVLIKDKDFAYTLFGEKPCSIADYRTATPYSHVLVSLNDFETPIFERGWEAWCKYSYLFPSDNFVLKKIISESSPGIRTILFINKKALLTVIDANKEFIQKHLQAPLSTFEIFEKITAEDHEDWTFSSTVITGMILGYGTSNAQLFERCFDLSLMINKDSLPPLKCHWNKLSKLGLIFVQGYSKHKQEPSSESFNDLAQVTSLIDELNYLTKTREVFELPGGDQLLEDFHSPVFVGVSNNPETESLSKIYQNDREKILKAYHGKAFMEVTLNQWINN